MIAKLRGVLEKNNEQVILDVQGVGYGLSVPETVLRRLPETGAEVTLQIYTHVREDQISLYGFSTVLEKDVFLLLMSASGVGPKLALAILSSLEALQILEAVAKGDRGLFTGISGVGKKTVEKLFVEIREKAEKRLLLERGETKKTSTLHKLSGASADAGWVSDLEGALVALGYRENDVRALLRDLPQREEAKDFDSALRLALKLLSGNSNKPKGIRGNA
jgi:Holliday junction DNA helicase RuvA